MRCSQDLEVLGQNGQDVLGVEVRFVLFPAAAAEEQASLLGAPVRPVQRLEVEPAFSEDVGETIVGPEEPKGPTHSLSLSLSLSLSRGECVGPIR